MVFAMLFALAISGCADEKKKTPKVYELKTYGTVGDGVANDTAAIQAAIDAASLKGGGKVVGRKRDTYLIYSTGSQPGYPRARHFPYALRIPSNITLDLRGGTLKLADGQNTSMIMNMNTEDGFKDKHITLRNMTLDNNGDNQTDKLSGNQAALYFYGVDDLRVENVTVRDAWVHSGRIRNVSNSYFHNIHADGSHGDCWMFGQTGTPDRPFDTRDSYFGTVTAKNCSGVTSRAAGNSFVGAFKRSFVPRSEGWANC